MSLGGIIIKMIVGGERIFNCLYLLEIKTFKFLDKLLLGKIFDKIAVIE